MQLSAIQSTHADVRASTKSSITRNAIITTGPWLRVRCIALWRKALSIDLPHNTPLSAGEERY